MHGYSVRAIVGLFVGFLIKNISSLKMNFDQPMERRLAVIGLSSAA